VEEQAVHCNKKKKAAKHVGVRHVLCVGPHCVMILYAF
jgi:triosephosphate isomerase